MIPWYAIGITAAVGLVSLLCGFVVRIENQQDVEGEKRMIFGAGLLGASLILAIGNGVIELGRFLGWWA